MGGIKITTIVFLAIGTIMASIRTCSTIIVIITVISNMIAIKIIAGGSVCVRGHFWLAYDAGLFED